MNYQEIQEYLKDHKLDGWLLYDFQGTNPIARSVAQIEGMSTRRWYCFIPSRGELQWIIPAIERHLFESKPGQFHIYKTWKGLWEKLSNILKSRSKIAMEYSPNCAIPYISRVDAGTVELVNQMEIEIVSSGDLVQHFQARLTEKQYESHLKAVDLVYEAKDSAIHFIRHQLDDQLEVSEWMTRQFLADEFKKLGLITNYLPIVAVNENAGNPHYESMGKKSSLITKGDLVLMDIWAKINEKHSIYADITWMSYVGEEVPTDVENVWTIVRDARDRGVQTVKNAFIANDEIRGYEIDDATRQVIQDAGYGDYFIHRTGHNIHEEDHGNGAHIDNFETHDARLIVPRTCFSIEPGVYLPQFGVRSEINVYIDPVQGPIVTTPPQTGLTIV
ncbi:MAG: hypothetical protein B6244_12655 [Candidatus Cloacimonetes bacterium 4572_55]|nr:MAG: hypothetical protein B6244_12655 [Candidatus Cloacimonetes bacterium 4572_55]